MLGFLRRRNKIPATEIMMKNDSTILQYVISTNISLVHNITKDRTHYKNRYAL